MKIARATGELAKELLWPTRCAVCDAQGEVLCERCKQSLRYIDSNKACKRCGAFGGAKQCSECNNIVLEIVDVEEFPLDALRHAVILNEDARRIVTTYKDGTELRLSKEIALIMARYVEPAWMAQNAIVTFIPPTKEAVRRRGFNHMELIAKELCTLTHLQLANLFEVPESSDQRALTRKERIANMRQVLKPRKRVAQVDRPVLIIDDVCTTGATMYSAATTLKNAGVACVYGLTFARVMT